MYYVYFLKSLLHNEFYVGSTNDLKQRMKDHNLGKVFSTKRYMPWKLLYYEAYLFKKSARMREKRLKHHGNALRELKKRIGLGLPSTSSSKSKTGAGFTLVEILVVIGILGILATALIVIINPTLQIQRSRDSRRKADLKQIQTGLELYRADIGSYPAATNNKVANCPSGVPTSLMDNTCNSTTYIQNVPKDPVGPGYYYRIVTGGYRIYGCVENPRDTGDGDTRVIWAPSDVSDYFGSRCPIPSGGIMKVFMVSNP